MTLWLVLLHRGGLELLLYIFHHYLKGLKQRFSEAFEKNKRRLRSEIEGGNSITYRYLNLSEIGLVETIGG